MPISDSPNDPGRALRILVIDDDDVARAVVVDVLQRLGHDVSDLPSPIGVTRHILASDVDVVVIDVMMPSMRGDRLAALLGRNPKLRHLGVVLVTGAPKEQVGALANEVSATAVVEKAEIHSALGPAVRRAVKARLRG